MNNKSKKYVLMVMAILGFCNSGIAQIDVEHVISIGRNALYFNDYVVSIGYFNRVIDTRPWLAEPYLYRAIAKISLDDYVGAEADAKESMLRNPYISRAYLVRGVALQNLGRYEEAISDYKMGIRLSPDNAQMRFNKAVAELKSKRLDDAERTTDSLLIYSPKYSNVYALRANISLEKQDTTLALQQIAKAIKIDPTQSLPYRLQAAIYANRSNWFAGIESISKVLELDGGQADLYAQRAIMRYQTNNLRAAMEDYGKAVELNPKHLISLHNRAILRKQVGEKALALEDWGRYLELEPNNYLARYNRALLIIESGHNLDKAIADLDLVLKQYPSFSDGFMQRSILRRKLGDKKGSEQDYWRANDLIRNKQLGASALATARNNQKKITKKVGDDAIDKYALLIEGNTSVTPDVQYKSRERGRVQDRNTSIEQKALYHLTFFIAIDDGGKPISEGTYYSDMLDEYNREENAYRLSMQSGSYSLSSLQIKELEALLSEPEHSGEVRYFIRRGVIHSLLQDYEQAILDYNKALALEPRNSLALWARSIASMRYAEAKAAYEANPPEGLSVTKKVGDSPEYRVGTAKTLGIVPSALQDLGQLLMLYPNFAYAYYNRGVLYASSGDRKTAIIDYTKALELNPRLREAYYNRGLLLLAEGQTREGIIDLSKAGELGLYEAYNIIKRMQ